MDERNRNISDPWEQDSFRTGSTRPPKRRSGLVAVLLIAVILLCSISGALGILNIRLFSQLQEQKASDLSFYGDNNALPLPSADATVPDASDPPATTSPRGEETLELVPAPEGTENIPQYEGLSLQEIYAQAIDSVVSIACTLNNGSSSGTGVVLTETGYIVTNSHVIENATAISVLLTDGRTLAARVVGADTVSDLAVLWVDAEDLTAAQFGDAATLRVGDIAVAIGDPLGIELRGTMTDGIISAINRNVTSGGRTMTLIQTNAALNSGNSGGPLLNCYGQVIGINTMKIGAFTDSAGVEGLGFAIPSTTVKEIVDQLIAQGYVSGRPSLGLTLRETSITERQFYRLPSGLLITGITENSDAARKGLKAGDILIELDEKNTPDQASLEAVIYSHKAGDALDAVIYRSGRYYSVQLILGEATG
ncbi:MAG: trypsin-like peptidase domain-containing protein [Oscillospiraceae bacterium]|nr:trypsin-like peptidase domain-containing protein [Oscillospiraceae bacterium]